jgi:hypothetical protein
VNRKDGCKLTSMTHNQNHKSSSNNNNQYAHRASYAAEEKVTGLMVRAYIGLGPAIYGQLLINLSIPTFYRDLYRDILQFR